MEGKVNIRAKMQEKLKALKEKRQAVKTVEKMTPSLFWEKMLEQRNKIRTIIEQQKNKEVSHD